MTKKPVIETAAVPPPQSEASPAPTAPQEPARGTGFRASIKHAKDIVVDKMAHPHETAGELKEWAERSARSVDVALENVQNSLASVNSSIGQAREWTSDKATQVDRILAGAQDIVMKIDDSVEAVQGTTNRVVDSLHEEPQIGCAPPPALEDETDRRVETPRADEAESDGAWGARTDRPER